MRKYSAHSGFSFIELMVVVVIMAIIATAVVPRFMGATDQARVSKAQADIKNISTALGMYRLDNGFYPSTEQGINALLVEPTSDPLPTSYRPGGYLEGDAVPVDPWDTPYVYRLPGTGNKEFDLLSLGADKREGGADYDADIVN
jgi:general secretion pathway protein G